MRCHIAELALCNFRSYRDAVIELNGESAILIGRNGSGKTTLLEAISLMAKSDGMRGASITDMQSKFCSDPWCVSYGFFDGLALSEIQIRREGVHRVMTVDGKRNRSYSLKSGLSNILWFMPEMDYLFIQSPSKRMKFLSRIVSIFKNEYAIELIRYNKAKLERSKILKNYKNNDAWLSTIESVMLSSGLKLSKFRHDVVTIIYPFFCELNFVKPINIFFSLKSDVFELTRSYDDPEKRYEFMLRMNRERDCITGKTAFGAHHDTLRIYEKDSKKDITLCSTGEQKLVLLSVLIATVVCSCASGRIPVLLLDDIFSHLDDEVRLEVMRFLIEINCQILLTDIDLSKFAKFRSLLKIIRIKEDLKSFYNF